MKNLNPHEQESINWFPLAISIFCLFFILYNSMSKNGVTIKGGGEAWIIKNVERHYHSFSLIEKGDDKYVLKIEIKDLFGKPANDSFDVFFSYWDGNEIKIGQVKVNYMGQLISFNVNSEFDKLIGVNQVSDGQYEIGLRLKKIPQINIKTKSRNIEKGKLYL